MEGSSAPCTDKYEPTKNEIVEIYIDRALNLPANCSIARVTVKFLKAFAPDDEKPKLTNYFTCHAQGENFNISPSFNFRLLCTVGTGPSKNPNLGKYVYKNIHICIYIYI
jgi:hypothetical protein